MLSHILSHSILMTTLFVHFCELFSESSLTNDLSYSLPGGRNIMENKKDKVIALMELMF